MTHDKTIDSSSTMSEIIHTFPSAQRALFQRYHIGGCGNCGYRPEETLGEVAQRKNIDDLEGLISFIYESAAADEKLKMAPQMVAEALKSSSPPLLIDVRPPKEFALGHIKGARHISNELAREMMGWSPSTPIVFYCHLGDQSLDAASYFSGHGFTNVHSLEGGIDAWAEVIDPTIDRYEVLQESVYDEPQIKSLRSAVSQEQGCRRS